jgi:hypothetical protein
MAEVLVLVGLAFAVTAVIVTFAIVAFALKLVVKLVLLPLLLLKWLIMTLVMLIVGPILFVVGLFAALAVGLALVVPLLPFVALGMIVWMIVKANRPAVA